LQLPNLQIFRLSLNGIRSMTAKFEVLHDDHLAQAKVFITYHSNFKSYNLAFLY